MRRINLKKLRIELDLKSQEMAEKLGISKQYYSNIENGRHNPSYEVIEVFEKVFNVDEKDVWGLFKKA